MLYKKKNSVLLTLCLFMFDAIEVNEEHVN